MRGKRFRPTFQEEGVERKAVVSKTYSQAHHLSKIQNNDDHMKKK